METDSVRLARCEERIHALGDQRLEDLTELRRRLIELNGEHKRIGEVLRDSVTQDRFDQYVTYNDEKRELSLSNLETKLSSLEATRSDAEGQAAGRSGGAKDASESLTRNIAMVSVGISALIVIITIAQFLFR